MITYSFFKTPVNNRLAGYLFVMFFFTGFSSLAQEYNLHIRIKSIPTVHAGDTIYVAGSFNEWNPGNVKYEFVKKNEVLSIDIPGLKQDIYQFKFTRGDWSKVQIHADGSNVENHLLKLSSDTTVEYTIDAWQDDVSLPQRLHTISPHVKIIDSAFTIPQLDRKRRIWIYLPEGYAAAKNKKRYPVLYMQDGQNIFDTNTSAFGNWGIDACLDSLILNGQPASIVVGIDCGPKRMNEYNPYYFEKFGAGEGVQYVDFLVNTLKPYIDKRYRTLKTNENTMVAGSSMGGLISYYAMLTHPGVFGKAGVFSPAFWTAPAISSLTDSLGNQVRGKMFFYMGELEGGTYINDMKNIADSIGKKSDAVIYTVIDPDGRHNEQAWSKWFPEFYCWIMGDGFNNQIKIEK